MQELHPGCRPPRYTRHHGIAVATYVIIDSSQRIGFHRRLEDRGIEYRSLFDGHAEQKHPEIAPLLFEWAELPDRSGVKRVQDDILNLAKERPAVSFIESDSSLGEIAGHFRRFHLVKLPSGREMLLRWYDTRILPVWIHAMNEAQRATFTNGIHNWSAYDRYGDIIRLSCDPDAKLPALTPFELDPLQYDMLLAACSADVMLAHLRQVAPDQLRRIDLRVLYPFVDVHLQQAKAHGLDNLDDQAHYLLLALFTSGAFRDHPHVQDRLGRHASEHVESFADWAMDVPDDVYASGETLWHRESFPRDAAIEGETQ